MKASTVIVKPEACTALAECVILMSRRLSLKISKRSVLEKLIVDALASEKALHFPVQADVR